MLLKYASELAHHMLGHLSLNLVGLGVTSFDNLFAKFFFEILFFSQEAWLHKVEKAPQLRETVFDWSTGQNEFVLGANIKACLMDLCSTIFNFLSLVEDCHKPIDWLEDVNILSELIV